MPIFKSRYNSSLYFIEKIYQLFKGPDLPDADSTIIEADGNLRIQSKQTSNRVIRLGASGAGNNAGIEIQKPEIDGFTLAVIDDTSSALLYTFPGNMSRASDFIFDIATGAWKAGGNVRIKAY